MTNLFVRARVLPWWAVLIAVFVGPVVGAWDGVRVARGLGLASTDATRQRFEHEAAVVAALLLTLYGLFVAGLQYGPSFRG